MSMNAEQKRRVRTKFENACLAEEDLKISIGDWERELASADRTYEGKRIALLTAQLADLRAQLQEAQRRADELRALVRDLDIPPAETPHPGGGAAAVLARDRIPPKWDTGGSIGERNAGWDAPVEPARSRR